MCKCNETIKPLAYSVQTFAVGAQTLPDEPLVRIQYQGGGAGKTNVYGSVTRQFYGRRVKGETFMVFEQDARAQPGLFQAVNG